MAFGLLGIVLFGISFKVTDWLTPGGQVYGGAQAVARLLMRSGGAWAYAGALLALPPVRPLAAAVYRAVARHRHRMPGGTPACALPGRRTPP